MSLSTITTMMDNSGQPDSKRPRTVGPVPGPPTPWNSSRDLPQPQPICSAPPYQQHGSLYARQSEPQTNPLDAHRRHSAHSEHRPFDQDTRRPNSGPSAHVYHQPATQPPTQLPPFGGQQDVMMKREPTEEAQYRPASTGSAPDQHVAPTHGEGRYQQHLPPFELAQHPRTQSYQAGPPYVPASPLTQSPMPSSEPHALAGYGTPGPPRQDYVTYHPPIQKKKPPRAAQACDSCRGLKARCDEGRPMCSSCKERGFQCVYRDPPPKQQDRTTAELMDAVTGIHSTLSTLVDGQKATNEMAKEMARIQNTISDRLARVESAVFPSRHAFENDDARHMRDFQAPAPKLPSSQPLGRLSGPPPLTTTALEGPLPPPTESPYPSNTSQQPASDLAVDIAEEEEDGPPVNPGQPSIPVNHTTGNARLLLNRAISELAHGIIKTDKIRHENYPMVQENRRGLLRLFGRGEGVDQLPGYERDAMNDSGNSTEGTTPTPSDASSDAGSPGADWGQLGGLTPPGEPISRGHINQEGMPDFTAAKVHALVDSYMQHMNNMHPILVPAKLATLVDHFLKSIPETAKPKAIVNLTSYASVQGHVSAGFVAQGKHPESPSHKRKRSPGHGDGYEPPTISDFKPGQPFRSIGTAIVLLVMALGEICQQKGKIPDCAGAHDSENHWGSPAVRNGHPPSPSGLQSSPSLSTLSGLPSPAEADRMHPRSRRTSVEGFVPPKTTPGTRPKNLDIIPGLQYYAFATDILGNQVGGNTLQHVHANILASLYHGQLGRPLESHGYLHLACRALQVILRPKLDRFKRLKQIHGAVPQPRDNHLIIAFWTCLQLESDLVAELPVPHSGILTYEEDMPGLNLQAAVDGDKFDPWVITSYAAQLSMRKHLNQLHNMFYKPVNDSEFPSVFSGNRPPPFKTIDASLQNLEDIKSSLPNMHWNDGDPPATDVLRARFRAKYYGAKVITYRPFLEMVLNNSSAQRAKERAARESVHESPQPKKYQEEFSGEQYKKGIGGVPEITSDASVDEISQRVRDYAHAGITALINSTTAFHGLGDPRKQRLIVTNVWGTAHAQWGNMLTLLAASVDPVLGPMVNKQVLQDLYDKTMGFLKLVAQPSSALSIDIKILEHVAREIGMVTRQAPLNSSFSSSGGDAPVVGH